MNIPYSANAVYAKAHALYGKRLKKQNYDDLLNCHSLNELINYLKTRTAYGTSFEKVPSDISAAQIEEILKLNLLENLEALCRYEISAGENVYEYFIMKNDVKQILSMVRLLINGKPEEYLNVLPAFFTKHSKLDLYSMANAKSFADLLKIVKGSPYEQSLIPFEETFSEKDIYIAIEASLNDFLKSVLFSIIDKRLNRKEKKQLCEIINYKFDMDALVNIYRLRRLENAGDSVIKEYINSKFTNFTKKDIDLITDSIKSHDLIAVMSDTFYKKNFYAVESKYLEGTVQQVMYEKFSKSIRYLTSPTATMLCYAMLSENEVNNIIHIVEGIKYKIPSKQISTVLVGADKN